MCKEIPVFFSIDDGYAPYLAAALCSAVEHAREDRHYRAIILHQDLSEAHQKRLKALEKPHFQVEFVQMQKGLESITDRMSNRLRCDYFTLTIYFRLFIPAMFPQYDKGIYIDSDVILQGDLSELFDTDIGDNYLGACTDLSIQQIPELIHYIRDAIGVAPMEYINSGVLLMNLKALRQAKLEERFLELLQQYHLDCVAPDQDYLNALCAGKIYYLDPAWDAMPNENQPPLEAPKLIHYNLFSKPWCYDGIQYGDLFWKYVQSGGYYEEASRHKAGYTAQKQAADRQCLDLLICRADAIPDTPVTFQKLHRDRGNVRL